VQKASENETEKIAETIMSSPSRLTLRRILRKVFRTVGGLYWTAQFQIKLWYNGVSFGKRIRATGPVHLVVHPDGSLRMGDCVFVNSGSGRNPVGGGGRCIIDVGKGAHLEIGSNIGMSNCEIVCRKQIVIGDYCLLGGGVRVYDSDFHSVDCGMRRSRPDPGIRSEVVELGSDVFVGAHATILKGVLIGKRSVIGAGAVVAKSVPADEIWAGNPARRIGSVENNIQDKRDTV
jgi:acetyltransferase-like isoleucine patch superfamily enzyme